MEAGYTDTKGQKRLCKCLYYSGVRAYQGNALRTEVLSTQRLFQERCLMSVQSVCNVAKILNKTFECVIGRSAGSHL